MLANKRRNFSAAAIFMLLAGVQTKYSVTLSSWWICAIKGSTIKIPCKYSHPHYSSVTQSQWYRVGTGRKPQDLSTDPLYSGRVSVSTVTSDCELTLRDVRVSDSGVYKFRFHTDTIKWKSASSGIHLTVTDLKIEESKWRNGYKRLSCITTCTLSNTITYIWYKNGQNVTERNKNILYLYDRSRDAGSYSCAVREHEELRSPAVCVFEKSCWSVTYSTQTFCALIGSTVDIHSYYTFTDHYRITKAFWFIKEQADGQADGEPVDVREDEEYQGRVQYTQSSQNNCSLRITNLRASDTQTYRFRFYTDDRTGKYTGQPGVSLSVTDLRVTISDLNSWSKKLSCITTCPLTNNPTSYIWYKNEQRVTNQEGDELYVSSGDPGSYSCAVRGHEELRSPAVYAPRITTVTAVPSVSGDSVTLLCKSDSNPISNYTWTRRTEGGVKLAGNGNNLTLHSGADGLYYCTAANQLGSSDSSGWAYTSDNRAVKYAGTAVTVALVLIFITVILWLRRKASAVSTRSEEHSKNDSVHEYDNISAMTSDPTQTASSENQDNVQYSTVSFSQQPTNEVTLYSTVQLPKAVKQEEEVEYGTVSCAKPSAAGEDEIYNILKPNK